MNTQHRDHAPPHPSTDCRGLVAEPPSEKVTAISGGEPLFNMFVGVKKKLNPKKTQTQKGTRRRKNANRKWMEKRKEEEEEGKKGQK